MFQDHKGGTSFQACTMMPLCYSKAVLTSTVWANPRGLRNSCLASIPVTGGTTNQTADVSNNNSIIFLLVTCHAKYLKHLTQSLKHSCEAGMMAFSLLLMRKF